MWLGELLACEGADCDRGKMNLIKHNKKGIDSESCNSEYGSGCNGSAIFNGCCCSG